MRVCLTSVFSSIKWALQGSRQWSGQRQVLDFHSSGWHGGVWEDLMTVFREGKDPGMEGHEPDQETPRAPQHGTRGALFEQY